MVYQVIMTHSGKVAHTTDSIVIAKQTCDELAANYGVPFSVIEVRTVWSSETLDKLITEDEKEA